MEQNSGAIAYGDLSKNKKFDKNTDQMKLSNNFYEAGKKYFEVANCIQQNFEWMEVTLTNISFSCELLLKAILYSHGIDFLDVLKGKERHDLQKLFQLLPESEREYISTNIAHHKDDFHLCLKEQSQAFDFYRYSCEAKAWMGDPIFLFCFAHILKFVYEVLREQNCIDTEQGG